MGLDIVQGDLRLTSKQGTLFALVAIGQFGFHEIVTIYFKIKAAYTKADLVSKPLNGLENTFKCVVDVQWFPFGIDQLAILSVCKDQKLLLHVEYNPTYNKAHIIDDFNLQDFNELAICLTEDHIIAIETSGQHAKIKSFDAGHSNSSSYVYPVEKYANIKKITAVSCNGDHELFQVIAEGDV